MNITEMKEYIKKDLKAKVKKLVDTNEECVLVTSDKELRLIRDKETDKFIDVMFESMMRSGQVKFDEISKDKLKFKVARIGPNKDIGQIILYIGNGRMLLPLYRKLISYDVSAQDLLSWSVFRDGNDD